MPAESDPVVTLDTNIAVYALTSGPKAGRATAILSECKFASVQLLNEYANVARRKRQDSWDLIRDDVAQLRQVIPLFMPIDQLANRDALRLCSKHQLSFYDALMIAVALKGGASILYSEDMQHGLHVDGRLRIINPFR
jgi:predicted nucleic acid-binding protein